MEGRNGIIGGFVGENESKGQIENCYCITKFNGKKLIAGGFAGKSTGMIHKSYCTDKAKHLQGAFCGQANKLGNACYVLNSSGRKSSYEKLWDAECLRAIRVIKEYDAKVWSKGNRKQPFLFRQESWQLAGVTAKADPKRTLVIKTVEELYAFAKKVNAGNSAAISCWVRLENDLDLRGKQWIPIGYNRNNVFAGVFDGNGHTISNFYVQDDSYTAKGFFGYLKGQVLNLSLDCVLKGDGKIGALTAVNEGVIAYCGVTFRFVGSGGHICVGGLCGVNSGKILKSYAAGEMTFLLFPIWPIPIVMAAMLVAFVLVSELIPAIRESQSIYQPIAKEARQHKIENNEDRSPENSEVVAEGGTVLSFSFHEYIEVSATTGTATLYFENPSNSTNKVVVELSIVTETGEVVIAKSGAIFPGYGLDSLILNEEAYDVLWMGEATGNVRLYSYNPETNEKSMLETTLPVTLDVY